MRIESLDLAQSVLVRALRALPTFSFAQDHFVAPLREACQRDASARGLRDAALVSALEARHFCIEQVTCVQISELAGLGEPPHSAIARWIGVRGNVEGPLFCYVGADGCPAPERPLDLAEVRGILRERSPGVLPDLTSSEKRDCARRFIFGWLLTILRNDAGEALRQDNRRSRDLSLDAGGQHTTPLADRLPAVVDSVDPAHSVLVKEVLAELECIPDDERFVLKSYYLDEMTLEEIGRLLALMRGRHEPVSRQYVQQIKARGLNRMRQILNG